MFADQQAASPEVTVFDRPGVSVVPAVRGDEGCYLLRVRRGASRSLVTAATRTLADAGQERGQRTLGDVTEVEFAVLEPVWAEAA
jgi:hypothetical protein